MSAPSPASSSPFPEPADVHIGLSDAANQKPFSDFQTAVPLKNGHSLQFDSKDLSSVLQKKKLDLTLDGQSYTVHIGVNTPLFKQLQKLSQDPNDAPVAKALLYKNAVAMLALIGQEKRITATFKGTVCETILIGDQELDSNKMFTLNTRQADGYAGALTGTDYKGGQKTRLVTLQITYLSSDEKIAMIRKKFMATPAPTTAAASSPATTPSRARRGPLSSLSSPPQDELRIKEPDSPQRRNSI